MALEGQDSRMQRQSRTHPSSLTCGFSTPHLAISTIHCFHPAGYSCWDFSTSTPKWLRLLAHSLSQTYIGLPDWLISLSVRTRGFFFVVFLAFLYCA